MGCDGIDTDHACILGLRWRVTPRAHGKKGRDGAHFPSFVPVLTRIDTNGCPACLLILGKNDEIFKYAHIEADR